MSKRTEANKIIRKHVIWSLGGGLIPIPMLDFTAVTAIQIDMLSQLATLYGADYTASTGKTFVAALTGSTFAKIGASLVKIVPGIGTVIGGLSMSIMSGASTYAVGKVAVTHFETGGNLLDINMAMAKKAYEEAFEEGKEYASSVDREKEASQDVYEALEKLGRLKEQGVITEEEFQAQKEKLLDRI